MPDLTSFDIEMIERREYCDGLRAAADFFEANPGVRLPHDRQITSSSMAGPEHDRPYMLGLIRALGGRVEKVFSGNYIYFVKIINRSFKLQFLFERDTVCERIVTGTKQVPEQVIAAHVEEIVEWKCASALAPPQPTAQQPEAPQLEAPAPYVVSEDEVPF